MSRCLIIFAKEPEKGKVKTRLSSCLSDAQALNLYKAFLKDTISIARKINCEEKILAYEAGSKQPEYLHKVASRFRFYKQKGMNLGEKLHNAFKFAGSNGAERTIVIGSDSPALPAERIADAFAYLNMNDLVIGPSIDGGYYLIGLKRPCPELFRGITWSSETVMGDTVKKAKTLNKTIAILRKYYDVDDSYSLDVLKRALREEKNISVAKWTKRALRI